MAEKDKVQLAAELLLNGASMLGIACPRCRDPIYLLRDKTMFCATCNSSIAYENSIGNQEEKVSKPESDKLDPIQAKIDQLSAKLKITNDPDEIISIANTIKKLQQISK